MKSYLDIMDNFTIKNIPDLDTTVMAALELFSKINVPKVEIGFKRPLVVGSGNAAVTGKIIFSDKDAVFADESSFKEKLKNIKDIDGVVLISASGGKHAPLIARESRKHGKKVFLITNNQNAFAVKFSDKHLVFPKNREPYTYNTSTYLGMIFGKTKENPKDIFRYLNKLDKKAPTNLGKFDAFYFIIPERFDLVKEMFLTKFDELFGAMVSGRVFTFEQTKHAKTVVPSSKELFISFGVENKVFGRKKMFLPLPKKTDFALMMAVGYYVIGKIQRQHPAYFKENILRYVKESSKIFGEEIREIVEK